MNAPASSSTSRLVPIIIGSALFMQTLDATIIANALPAMARSFGADPLRLNLAISVYLLSTAVFLPLSAWIADRFGAQRVFVASIALFALSSCLCGLSQSLPQLLGARVLQGIAGAAMTPVGRLVLLKTVPKSELVRAMAVLTMPALIGPVVGPILGGFIVTYGAWQWIFFINVPIGLIGIVLVGRHVPNVREEVHQPLDILGFAWVAAGLATIMVGLESVGRGPLPPAGQVACVLSGCLCLWLYGRHARRTPAPLIDLALFRVPSFSASVFGGAFARLIIGAGPFLLALLFQIGFGLSAFQAGLLTFTSAAGAFLMKTAAPPILRRFGFRRVLLVNTFLTAAVLATQAAFTPHTPYLVMALVLFTGGFLRSLQFTSLGTLAFADVSPALMSRASSVTSMGAQLAQAVGVAVAAIVLHAIVRLTGAEQATATHTASVFVVIAMLSLPAALFYWPLPRDVAAEVAGTKRTDGG